MSTAEELTGLLPSHPCLTGQPSAAAVLQELLDGILGIFGRRLVGFYLYGSQACGDFDPEVSDIDTLALVADEVTPEDVSNLRIMHDALTSENRHPDHATWRGRIETQYAPEAGLRTFRTIPFLMANISPGEPIHLVDAGREWLVNWYFVQTYGIALYGPPPRVRVHTDPPLAHEEFLEAIRDHALSWEDHVAQTAGSRAYQGYAVLTMCRAMNTLAEGRQVSKREAARWARKRFPGYTGLILEALEWRTAYSGMVSDPSVTYPRVEEFVRFAISHIRRLSALS